MAKATKASKQQFTEIPPNAAKTFSALRELGYDSFASMLDLIDNGIDAGATKIQATIKEAGSDIVISIRDNGNGMAQETLAEALRLGSDTTHDAKVDLGKFGMGLVTASISMARNVYIITRQKGKAAFEASFDLDVVARENRFVITLHPASRSDRVLDMVGDQGTVVRLSRIDRINDTNVSRLGTKLRERCGQVYRHFLNKGLSIVVNGKAAKPIDPLMLDHPLTAVVFDDDVTIERNKAFHLKVVELPELGQQADLEANITPHNSGFYIVRSGREIMEAQTFGFYQRHHSYSRFRAELSFTGDLDSEFHVDVKKATIQPGERLLSRLKDRTDKLITQSGRRGREDAGLPVKLHHGAADVINMKLPEITGYKAPEVEAPKIVQGKPVKVKGKLDIIDADKPTAPSAPRVVFAESDTGDTGRFFSAESRPTGETIITYNTRHPFVRMVADIRSRQAHSLLGIMAFALSRAELEVEGGSKVVNKACDYLKMLSSAQPPEAT